MASGLITSWQIEGEKVEAVTDFIFLSSRITVDNDCSHEIKRQLLLGRKTMIMEYSPNTSWQVDGEIMETQTLFWGCSKITVDSDYSHKIKRRLHPGRKALTNSR